MQSNSLESDTVKLVDFDGVRNTIHQTQNAMSSKQTVFLKKRKRHREHQQKTYKNKGIQRIPLSDQHISRFTFLLIYGLYLTYFVK